jgi:DNA-binding MarR family transcriptional regulator
MAENTPHPEPSDPMAEFPLPPSNYFVHLALVLSVHWNARAEKALQGYDFDMAGFRALRVVNHFGAATMGEIADYTFSDRTTLTRVVDHLVETGLMVRSKPPGDRRKVVLTLTDEGRRLFRRAREAVSRDIDTLVAGMPDGEFRAAARLVQQLVERLAESPKLSERLLWLGPLDAD